MEKINQILDHLSNYFANRKGLLPIFGLIFVVINFIMQLIPGLGWLATSNLFLHFGLVLVIIGILLAWVL